jgi:hypothetical protein
MVVGSLLWRRKAVHPKKEDPTVDQDHQPDLDHEDDLGAGPTLVDEENQNQDPGPDPSLGPDLIQGPSLSLIMIGQEATPRRINKMTRTINMMANQNCLTFKTILEIVGCMVN